MLASCKSEHRLHVACESETGCMRERPPLCSPSLSLWMRPDVIAPLGWASCGAHSRASDTTHDTVRDTVRGCAAARRAHGAPSARPPCGSSRVERICCRCETETSSHRDLPRPQRPRRGRDVAGKCRHESETARVPRVNPALPHAPLSMRRGARRCVGACWIHVRSPRTTSAPVSRARTCIPSKNAYNARARARTAGAAAGWWSACHSYGRPSVKCNLTRGRRRAFSAGTSREP